MTDSTSWQPPAGAAPAAPPAEPSPVASPFAPPSPYAAPAPPSAAPPAPFGAPTGGAGGYAPPPGWTPPPKPGLIPLRPLTLGAILSASFQVMRRNPRPTFGFSLIVTGAIYVLTIGIVGVVAFFAFSRVQFATNENDAAALSSGATAIVLLSALVPIALAIVGSAILQGIISLEVARGTLGEKLRLGGLWRAARGRIGALVGWSAILTGVVVVSIAIIAVVIALLVALGGTAGIVVGVLLGFLFAAVAVVAAVWLGTKLALVPSVLMLERLRLRDAIRRSWSLTNGVFWKTFGTLLLVNVIIQVANSIISAPLQLIASFAVTLLNPNGADEGLIAGFAIVYVLTIVFAVVFGAIGAIVQSATAALIYIDIRMRKEGLDLELTRFVEARQAGDTSVQNPYVTKANPAPAPAAASTSPWS